MCAATLAPEEWRRVFAVNVDGVWYRCRAASWHMKPAGAEAIVNIALVSVAKGNAWLLHYAGSKGYVIAMTRVLAREFGPHGIRVNTLSKTTLHRGLRTRLVG